MLPSFKGVLEGAWADEIYFFTVNTFHKTEVDVVNGRKFCGKPTMQDDVFIYIRHYLWHKNEMQEF